jgi:hypothetical protein
LREALVDVHRARVEIAHFGNASVAKRHDVAEVVVGSIHQPYSR